jgi:hypothetical protein
MQTTLWSVQPDNMEKLVKEIRKAIARNWLYHVTITRALGGSESFDWDAANGVMDFVKLERLDEDSIGIVIARGASMPVTRKIVFREEYSGNVVFDGENTEIRITMTIGDNPADHMVVTFSRS